MFRPEIYQNQRTGHWPQHFNPRGQFLRRNAVVNRFRPPVSSNAQINYQFWCETCDKGFQTLLLLNNHKLQHEKCNIDGCQFVAHPKIITKHIQMQHSTGLYEKIAKLNNPEEIQKWREERKRKYPTKQNQEKKAAEVKEKIERGEKMGLMRLRESNKQQKSGVYNKGKINFRNNKTRARQNNKFKNEQSHKPLLPKRVCKVMPLITEKCKLKPFTGIQQIVMDENIDVEDDELQQDLLIEDDELTNNTLYVTSQAEPIVCGALSSLMCNYGSSDDEVTQDRNITLKESSGDCINSKQLDNEPEKSQEKIDDKPLLLNSTEDKNDDDSGPEEIVIKKIATEKNNIEEEESKLVKLKTADKRVNNRTNIKVIRKPKYHLPSTLLVKLLSREIEQERNIILQCVRYVVKNNFFDNSRIKTET